MANTRSKPESLRREFGAAARAVKLRAIEQIARATWTASRRLREHHDFLLFLLAYPDDTRVARSAERALTELARRFRGDLKHIAARDSFDDSGIAGTSIRTTFSIDLLHWLTSQSNLVADIDWSNEEAVTALDRVLPLIASPGEQDGILSNRLTTQAWVERNRAPSETALAWLLRRMARLDRSGALLDDWFDSLNLPVACRLAGHSRTLTRFPPRPLAFNPKGFARGVVLPPLLEQALPKPVKLSAADACRLIDTARAVLAARVRETDPVTYANPRDITLYRLESGVDVLLLGMGPERRLPIESYVGFVAARNRVPIAYGGGWIFHRRCEIGVNLFEEFRGGESALLFGQVLRTYRQHFRVRQFLVPPYQFGDDNDEAIRSGAFWFYFRLGFRPIETRLRALADREHHRLMSNPGTRTSPAMLRKLATGKVFLDAPIRGGPSPEFAPVAPDLERMSLAITDWITSRFDGDRVAAENFAINHVVSKFAAAQRTRRPGATMERPALRRLAPLFALVDEAGEISAPAWPWIERLIRTKSAARESPYIKTWQSAPTELLAGLRRL